VVAAAIDAPGDPADAAPSAPAVNTPSSAAPSAAPAMTTMGQTVQLGAAGAGGYRPLMIGGGEPHLVRTELGGVLTNVTYAFGSFAHLSDLHIVDDQSPARTEWLDRLADNGNGTKFDTGSAYRPQESLSTHLVDAMCRSIRQIGRGPRTGLPFSFAIVTGDAVDNCQYNETRWYIDVLDGKPFIVPDSGARNNDESVSFRFGKEPSGAPHGHDNGYWSPENQTDADNYVGGAGFPHVPGLMTAARSTYAATGLGIRWYAAFGNHDRAIQGNLPVDLNGVEDCAIDIDPKAIAIGGQKPYTSGSSLPEHASPTDYVPVLNSLVMTPVSADPDRRLLNQQQFINEHFTTTGTPFGHGFGISPAAAKPYYAIPSSPIDPILYITLDSTARKGSGGAISVGQFEWLKDLLRANSSRFIDPSSGQIVTQPGVVDKLIVIFCHHTIKTMDNTGSGFGLSGTVLESLLLKFPNVIMMANGHTHANTIIAHPRPAGSPIPGGFWEVNSPSHIDWPVQSRIIEVAAGRGTISLFTTVIDIDAPLSHGTDISTPAALASLGRELSANDPQERGQITAPGDGTGTRRGSARDRNTQLLLPAPFALPDPVVDGSSIAAATTFVGFQQRIELIGTNDNDQVFHGAVVLGAQPTVDWKGFDGALRSVGAATNQNGCVEAFGVNGAGFIYHRVQTSPTVWDGSFWQGFDGSLRTIAAAVSGTGRVEVFGSNLNNEIVYRTQTKPGDWTGSGWGVFDGSLSQVAAATNRTGRIVLFGVNAWGAVVQRIQSSPGDWTGSRWLVIDGTLTTLAVGNDTEGYLQLFGVNEDGRLLTSKQAHAGDTFQPWTPVDGPNDWARHNVRQLAVQQNFGSLTLFGVDADGSILCRGQNILDAGDFGSWQPLGGQLRANGLAHTVPFLSPQPTQTTAAGATVSLGIGHTGAGPAYFTYAGLPAGLTGDGDGLITGRSTDTASRTYTVTVTLTDRYHLSTSVTFTWNIVFTAARVLVPNLTGDDLTSAEAELRAAGLVLGDVRTANDPSCTHLDKVMDQSPAANAQVDPGTAIAVYLGVLPPGMFCQ
jgi:metallophosphoesterase (TIGR03767 family)